MKIFELNYVHKLFFSYILLLPASHAAISVNDNLTGASSSYNWQALNGACLTAGNNTGSIPACKSLPYYSGRDLVGGETGKLPDPVGKGALRLTNGARNSGTNGDNQTGAVYSKFSFPSNAGVDITFKTVTYGGNGYPNHANVLSGADGMAFFLTDADQVSEVNSDTKIGAFGGSLGYSCANGKDINDGLYAAYLGLGIDEFGNFSNPGDNTNTGPGASWNRVSLRGAGTVNWKWLSENKSNFYSSKYTGLNTAAKQQAAVKKVCSNGKLYNYKNSTNGTLVTNQNEYEGFYNYPYLKGANMPQPIANQQRNSNPLRGNANPITYNIKITQNGLLSLAYSYNGGESINILRDQNITTSNGPLPNNFRFGFSAGTGGGSNVHEIMCFKADQITASSSSAAGNIPTLGRVIAGSQLYLAAYHTDNWWGQLTSQNLVENEETGVVSVNNQANWDASCNLTGGICESTGGNNSSAQTNRKLFTWNNAGVSLDWGNLSSSQQESLSNDTKVLDWLKGSRTHEINSAGVGVFRARDSLLGDIINSSPTWNGAPSAPYKDNWRDEIRDSALDTPENFTDSQKYSTFKEIQKNRTHAVYVGANDGFLHAFRSGSSKNNGTYDDSTNDGRELFAYMPEQVLRTVANTSNENLSLTKTSYAHNAFVDATPGVGDVFFDKKWHTWLVGGLGLGGNMAGVTADDTTISKGAIYALDVTDPDNFNTSKIIGEWNSDNLSCSHDNENTKCRDSLGSTTGTPLIRRLHDGNWAAIFPNGQNSKSGEAGVFIMTISSTDGSKKFIYLKAADPIKSDNTITKRNGISQITAVDLDGDHITDYLYGGDMLGNVWKFDLTGYLTSMWLPPANKPSLVYKTTLPITTAIAASATLHNQQYRVILNFGTGRLYPKTLTSMGGSAPGDHYLYGIWDADFGDWNSKGSTKYHSINFDSSASKTVKDNEILTRTITEHDYEKPEAGISGARSVSSEDLCWRGSTTCGSGNNKRGWRVKLPGKNEQIVYNPVLRDGFLIINTTIPEVATALSCEIDAASGYTMALPPDTGKPKKSYFMDSSTDFIIAGLGTGGVGSLMTIRSGSSTWGVTQTHSGKPKVIELDPSANSTYKRLNWIQRR